MTTEISIFHRTTQSCNQPLRKLRRLWLEHIAMIPPLCASEQHSSPSQECFHLFIYLFIIYLSLHTLARETRRRARVVQTLQKKLRRVRKCLFDSFSFFVLNATHRGFLLAPNEDNVDYDRIRTEIHNKRGFSAQQKHDMKPQSDVVRSWRREIKKGGGAWRSALVCITAAPRLIYFL